MFRSLYGLVTACLACTWQHWYDSGCMTALPCDIFLHWLCHMHCLFLFCWIRSSVLNQVVAWYVLACLLSSLICRWHSITDSDGFPQCPGMFVFQAVPQPTWHEWFRWSPTCLGMFVFQAALQATWHEWCRWTPTCLGMFVLQPELQAVTPGDIREWSGRPAGNVTDQKKKRNGLLAKGVAGIYVTEDLSVTKRMNVMVGFTRSKVI